MSFIDKAKDMLGKNDDKVDQNLDKAGEAGKGRFAGHDDKVDNVVDQAKQRTGDGDTTQAPEDRGSPDAEERDNEPDPGHAPPHRP